jgi:hypothetical protein
MTKMPERINLKEEMFIWAHSFIGFNPETMEFISGPLVRQSRIVEECDRGKSLTPGSQETEKEHKRGWGQYKPFKGTPTVTYFLQPGPTS